MKLSIIISVYNMEDYIEQCLASVAGQSCQDFEVILINDGSTDDTLSRCRDWERSDSRIRVVDQPNMGLGNSRNKGIEMASGEYIAFLDADDRIEKNFVKEMLSGTREGQNDIVICDMCYVEKADGKEIHKISAVRLLGGEVCIGMEKFLFCKCRTFLCAKLFKRSLFTENNVKLPPHAYEDISAVPYLISKAKSIYYVQEAMYCYLRNREGSIINDASKLPFIIRSLRELAECFKKDGSFETYRDELRSLFWSQVCHLWNLTRDRFSDLDRAKLQRIKADSVSCFCQFFPEGERLFFNKYYVCSIQMLADAVKHIVVTKEQIVDHDSQADCMILPADCIRGASCNLYPCGAAGSNEGIYPEKSHMVCPLNCELCMAGYREKEDAAEKPKIVYIDLSIYNDIDNKETISWNIADEILDKLV